MQMNRLGEKMRTQEPGDSNGITEQPENPDQPQGGIDENPTDPTDPETPTEPTDPETPTEPTDPETPTDPENPDQPVTPEHPDGTPDTDSGTE